MFEFSAVIEKYANEGVTSLNCSNNELKSVNGVEKLQLLEKLDLSKNRLSNLTYVSQLQNLVTLNVANNDIFELPKDNSWSRLESLDISGNRIASLEALTAICGMNSLIELQLSGNPVCRTAEYIQKIFNMQNNLQYVDGCHRDDYFQERPKEISLSEERRDSLLIQLEGKTNALELMEKSVANSGPQFVRQANVLGMKVSTDGSLVSQGDNKNVTYIEKELIDSFPYYRLLETWRNKVLKLITCNRIAENNLIKSVNDHKKDRTEFKSRIYELEHNAAGLSQINTALTAENKELQHKFSVSDTRLKDLQKEYNVMRDNFKQDHKQLITATSKLRALETLYEQKAVEDSLKVKHILDTLVSYEARLRQASEKLSLEITNYSLKQVQLRNDKAGLEAEQNNFRLQLIRLKNKEVVKEVKNKNTCTSSTNKSNTGTKKSTTFELTTLEDDDNDETSEDTVDERLRYLSDIQLNPELEGHLKHLFCYMDNDNTGLVLIQDFIDVFLLPSTEFEQQFEFLEYIIKSLIKIGVDGLLSEGKTFTPIGVEIFQLMGSTQFARFMLSLVCKLMSNVEARLTFGEFLLQIMPELNEHSRLHQYQMEYINHRISEVYSSQKVIMPSSRKKLSLDTRAPLSQKDLIQLKTQGLLGDVGFGSIPLQIPSLLLSNTTTATGSNRRDLSVNDASSKFLPTTNSNTIIPPPTPQQMQQDIDRLTKERHFLLKSIQDMTRSLERRAEGIKFYFEDELKAAEGTNKKLNLQLSKDNTRISVLESRVKEVDQSYTVYKERADHQITTLQQENIVLQERINARTSEEIKRFESELNETKAKFEKLQLLNRKQESEYEALSLSHKMLAKRNNAEIKKNDQLEKQIKDLNRQLADKQIEIKEKTNRFAELEAEGRCLLANNAESWKNEKQTLNERIEEAQKMIFEKDTEINLLQQQLAEVKIKMSCPPAAPPTETNTKNETTGLAEADRLTLAEVTSKARELANQVNSGKTPHNQKLLQLFNSAGGFL